MNRRELLSLVLLAPAIKAMWPSKPIGLSYTPLSESLVGGPMQGESFDLKMIDDLVEKAKAASPVIKSILIDGKRFYVQWLPHIPLEVRQEREAMIRAATQDEIKGVLREVGVGNVP